nr:reverse transcriptase domain-containing protein [Tanacetum cinerariifolium]
MALPDKQQLKFNIHKDAKSLIEAIENRFSGNKETKKVQNTLLKQQYENFTGSSSKSLDQIHDRLQTLISQLKILGKSLSQEDINLKFIRILPIEWRTHTLIWRNKTDLEDQSLDDLFNNLKIYKAEVKISTVTSVSAASTKVPVSALPNVDNLSDAIIYSFFASTKEAAGQDVKKDVSYLRYIVLPNWFHEVHLESSTSNAQDTCSVDAPESSGNSNPTATSTNPPADHMETLTVETPIPTVSSLNPITCFNESPEPSSDTRLISKRVTNQDDTLSLDNILTLTNRFEDILGVTTNTDDTIGVEADLGNMETTITASPTPTLRIHKDHLKKPKKIFDALQDPSWVEAMQEELLQFEIQNVWSLVDCPKGDEGINYDEVFAPVARIEAIRLFLAYASFMGFTVYQMDVKSAFLYGTIDEEVSSSKLSCDQTSNPTSSMNPTPKGRIRQSTKQKVENSNFEENPLPLVPMAENQTMAQLLQAPTSGYEDAIVIPEIAATNFELKHGLINLVQNKQFFAHEKEDQQAHLLYFNKITYMMMVSNVPNSTIKLMLFPFSFEGAARIWLEKEPPRSILTWDDLVSKFINQACPHHGFSELHQLDTFYNALNVNDQDSLNSAAGGNFLDKMPADCLKIIKSKSKTKKNQYSAQTSSPTLASIKAVEPNCVTCDDNHAYQNFPETSENVYQDNIQEYVSQAATANYGQRNTGFRPQMVANQIRPLRFLPVNHPLAYQAPAYQAPASQTQGVSQNDFERYIKANDVVLRNIQNQGQSTQNQCQGTQNQLQIVQNQLANLTDMMAKFMSANTASFLGSGTLPGTEVTKDQVQNSNPQSTTHVQPTVTQSEPKTPVSELVVAPVSAPMPNLKPSIPYPSRHDTERRRDQANEQIDKFYEIFKEMSFEISFTDALMLMPKFASTLKALIGNKEKFSEMARTLMNEHCSAVILNKLPKKLEDPKKFLIPCEFPGMDECLALADLGASINLMPLSVWKGLSLPELTLTCITLELVDRTESKPVSIAKDVKVKVETMTTVNQGMSVEEIERVVAQRVANVIEAIAIYETKTNLALKSMSQTERQKEKVAENASNKRKWESYIVDSKDEKDPKEDPAYYPTDRGDNDDDDDDDDVEKDEEDKEEEEHLASADPSDVSKDDLETMTTVNQRMSVEEIKRVISQQVANAIEANAIYETKTNLARNLKHYKSEYPIMKFHKRVDVIHGRMRASKPKIMQDAIEIATKLRNKKISTLVECQTENKKRLDNTSKNNQNQQQPNKRQNTGRAYTARHGEKKHYNEAKPLCSKCNYHHDGPCAPNATSATDLAI